MSSLSIQQLLSKANIEITAYNPKNKKAFTINNDKSYDMAGLCSLIVQVLGKSLAIEYRDLVPDLAINKDISEILVPYLAQKFPIESSSAPKSIIPDEYKNYRLNVDAETGDFFITDENDVILELDPRNVVGRFNISESKMIENSRPMFRKYYPYSNDRLIEKILSNGQKHPAINTYIVPHWKRAYKNDNVDISIFTRFIDHFFTLEEDKEYFYAWMKVALTERALQILVLTGTAGNGKNTLKEVLKGLLGASNVADGKMSTIKERFNGQLQDIRLFFGDEFHFSYGDEDEFKKLQNDTISIEKKK